jgi:GDP-4-dehydro-6-deoxy-D-mannose reductase
VKTIFVTGAGGYAGSHVVEHLRAKGHDVVAGVRNRARKLAYERHGIRSLVCDVADPINVARAVASARPDGVIHLAGSSRPQDATREPIESFQGLTASWVYILDAVRRAAPRARVLLVSSAEASGGNDAKDGGAAQRPASLFGGYKAAAESLAGDFNRAFQLDLSIARPYWYTGPNQPESACFPAALRRIRDAAARGDGRVEIADLDASRDVMHIDDLAAAYERVLIDGKPAGVYSICTGRANTVRELLESVIASAGLSIQLTAGAPGVNAAGPQGAGDPTHVSHELHWDAPRTGFDAVADLWSSMQASAERASHSRSSIGACAT